MNLRHLTLTLALALVPVLGLSSVRAEPDPDAASYETPAEKPSELVPTEPPAGAAAEEKPWALDIDLTWNSKYVWRGLEVTPDPVLQPSINFGYEGLTLNVWANLDTTDVNDFRYQANEIDYTLDYSFSWKKLDFSVGAIHYQFPQAHVFDTTEVYGAVGVDVLLSPTLTVYADVDEADGAYLNFSVGHSFEDVWKPCEDVSVGVDLGATVAYGTDDHNEFYYGAGSGWADATISVGMPIAIGDHVTVTPAVANSWFLDDDISTSVGEDHAFWGGVSVTVSF